MDPVFTSILQRAHGDASVRSLTLTLYSLNGKPCSHGCLVHFFNTIAPFPMRMLNLFV